MSGGEVYAVDVIDNTVKAELHGLRNDLKKSRPVVTIPFTVHIDPKEEVVKIIVQDEQLILKTGEWSDWVQLDFEVLGPLAKVSGICRFYLQSLRPDFNLYVTPINVDPANSVLPISYPASYAKELASEVGPFFTQGMAEDTKALSNDMLSDLEYIQQARLVLEERKRLYDYELSRFKKGLLFFYFSSLDQNSHMFWRALDETHPLYDPEGVKEYGGFIEDLYVEMDEVLGKTLNAIDKDTTLVVMSDHGFASFRRCFQINSWLKENGYVTLLNEYEQGEYEFFENVDWTRTKAYNLGINSVYINLKDREIKGTVDPSDKAALEDEIAEKLLQVRDPENGEQVVARVYKTREIFSSRNAEIMPDLIVGFNRGYRASWETMLGEFPMTILNDNDDKWSGDHCMATELVPGVLLANKRIKIDSPTLMDLAPTLLAEHGIGQPEQMKGRAAFDPGEKPISIVRD